MWSAIVLPDLGGSFRPTLGRNKSYSRISVAISGPSNITSFRSTTAHLGSSMKFLRLLLLLPRPRYRRGLPLCCLGELGTQQLRLVSCYYYYWCRVIIYSSSDLQVRTACSMGFMKDQLSKQAFFCSAYVVRILVKSTSKPYVSLSKPSASCGSP